jgi:hypothetical protein
MKNSVLSVILALFLAISISYAANVDIVESTITFNATDDGAITLKNNVNATAVVSLTGLEATHKVLGAGYKFNITTSLPISIGANSTASVVLSAPTDVQAGEYAATINVVNASNSLLYASVPVTVVVPALEISEIEVSDDSLEKGQTFTVTIKYENIAEETDIEDIKVTARLYEGDEDDLSKIAENLDGDKQEDDKDVSGTLRHESEKEVSFDFEFPFDVSDDDTFTVWVKLEGQSTKNSAIKFTAVETEEVTANVPDSKIEISKLSVLPSTLACGVNTAKISVEVMNIGDSTQDVQLFLRNPATGFDKILNDGEDLYLDNDYSDEDTFTEDVDEFVTLSDIKTGANTYQLAAVYNDGDNTETKEIVITQASCTTTDTTTDTTNDNSDDVIVTTPTAPIVPTTPTYPTTTPTITLKDVSGYSSFDSGVLVPVVIGALGLIIGVLVALLFVRRA